MHDNKENRLIVVSNRLPVVLKKDFENRYMLNPASGGLVTAMKPVLKRSGGVWIGWAGNYFEECIEVQELLDKASEDLNYEFQSVDISLKDYDLYYKGFSNEVLWPLFHNVSVYCQFNESYYEAFKRVNEQFAKTTVASLQDNDLVWIHDYHLINTGKELRKKGIKNKIAFFLHIPFPPSETFSRLPWRKELIEAFLSYDLIGFQTEIDKKNFLEVIDLLMEDVAIDTLNSQKIITTSKGKIIVGVFPISIDYNEFADHAGSDEVARKVKAIKREYSKQKIILGIDRLDYSKGVPGRLKAFRALLEKNSSLHKKVKFIQVMVPSREDVVKYASLKKEIEQLVGEINGKFSEPGWIPILYSYTSLNRVELLAYYRVAQVALITPLKDGMNLIAKEYCVSNIDKNGVLILSEFAGAKHQFKDDALLVNPFDEASVVASIKRALSMKREEKKVRMENLQKNVKKYDIYWWVDEFLKALK